MKKSSDSHPLLVQFDKTKEGGDRSTLQDRNLSQRNLIQNPTEIVSRGANPIDLGRLTLELEEVLDGNEETKAAFDASGELGAAIKAS